jgi:hypothetical protein
MIRTSTFVSLLLLFFLSAAVFSCVSANRHARLPRTPAVSTSSSAGSVASQWQSVGYGVTAAYGSGVNPCRFLLSFGGYRWTMGESQVWVEHVSKAANVSLYAIGNFIAAQGPADPGYQGKEIQTSHVVEHFQELVHSGKCRSADVFAIIIAHSSGAYVANDFLLQLRTAMPHPSVWSQRVVYFCLDGGDDELSVATFQYLARIYPSSARGANGFFSPNYNDMEALAKGQPNRAFLIVDSTHSGCRYVDGPNWCEHMVLITHVPHNDVYWTLPQDVTDVTPPHLVQVGYFDQVHETLLELAHKK